jgi:hypothetical protein
VCQVSFTVSESILVVKVNDFIGAINGSVTVYRSAKFSIYVYSFIIYSCMKSQ